MVEAGLKHAPDFFLERNDGGRLPMVKLETQGGAGRWERIAFAIASWRLLAKASRMTCAPHYGM